MASLTVRNIEEETKRRLRLRAARHGRSMEEEVRIVLREAAATLESSVPTMNLYDDIRQLVEPHGGFVIPVPERQTAGRPIPFSGAGEGHDNP